VVKSSALSINTSRSPLVIETAVMLVLKAGKTRGAVLEAYNIQSLPQGSEWRTTTWGRNGSNEVLLSPHV
jgi:phosphoglycerate dehydrogenase-like enzyme